MRKYFIYFFMFSLLHFCSNGFAQSRYRTLGNGSNILAEKPITFKNYVCKITPEIDFDVDNPNGFIINIKAEWLDKKNNKIEDNNNSIYLVDDFEIMNKYHRENGLTVDRSPKIEKEVKGSKAVIISKYVEGATIELFDNGFNGFKNYSKPVAVKLSKTVGSLIQIDFTFFHIIIKGNKRIIKEGADPISWKFMLPEKPVKDNICKQLGDNYNIRVNKITSKNQLTYFEDKLSLRNTDVLKLENELKQYLNEISKAEKLKEEIRENANLDKCPDVKAGLMNKLGNYLLKGKNVAAVEDKIKERKKEIQRADSIRDVKYQDSIRESKIVRKKTQAKKTKEESWKIYEDKYDRVLADLESDFNYSKGNIDKITKNVNIEIEGNSRHIEFLKQQEKEKDKLSADSLSTITNIFNSCVDVNNVNNTRIDNLLQDIRIFNSTVENKLNKCKSEFNKVDKKKGLQKSKKYRTKFNQLIDKIKNEEEYLEKIQDEISRNNKNISMLFGLFNPERLIAIQGIREKYNPLFAANYNDIQKLNDEFNLVISEFENEKYSKWFFEWVKSNLLTRTNNIYEGLKYLQEKQDSLIKQKDFEDEAYAIDIIIGDEQEFEKISISLKPRIEYLIKEIREWPHKLFPYFYVILIFFMILILGFGAMVYLRALKNKTKNTRRIKKNNSSTEKTSSGGIIIKPATADNRTKGKGLGQIRDKAGIDFLELNMDYEWDDSAVAKIYFHRDCIKKTYRFFEDSARAVGTESMANETGGYLIGRWDHNIENPDKFDVSLEEFIKPGDDATFSKYQLNFGAKIGVKLQKSLENHRQKENIDVVMTAWFHSHPGLKIFLSDFDLTVQEDFSRKENKLRMVALVLDPYTDNWDTGIFTYKTGGEMNNAKGSKQFFSLENMYRWAIGPVKANNHDNYFMAHISKIYPGSLINKVYFSNPCILEIKRHIEDNNTASKINGVTSFIRGHKVGGDHKSYDFVCENLVDFNKGGSIDKKEDDKTTACLITTSGDNPDISQIIDDPEIVENQISLILLYNYDDNTLILISKNKEKIFNKLPEVGGGISFTDMVTWTRKRK